MKLRSFQSIDAMAAIIFTIALIIAVSKFNIFATIDGYIHLKWVYYPTLNNVDEVMTAASDGRIQLTLPKGNYEVEIWYQGTLAERLGSLISFVTVLLLGGLWFSSKDNKNTPSNNTDESGKLLSEFR